jgi:hypothetical protein
VGDAVTEKHFVLLANEKRQSRPMEPNVCPLDLPTNIAGGAQHWLKFRLEDEPMVGLTNIFGFLPNHATIATEQHEPQSWRSLHPAKQRPMIERTLRQVSRLALVLPGYIAFFNATAASGASLSQHRHFHVGQPQPGFGDLPIQRAAANRPPALFTPIGFEGDYPLCGARFSGPATVSIAADFIEKWERTVGDAATVNIIALIEGSEVAIYVVLRTAAYRFAQGFKGVPGSMETAGVLVLSADFELQALRERRFDFHRVWSMLSDIRPPEARLML